MMKADEEMASILQADKDLIFPEKKVLVEIPKMAPTNLGTSQGSDDMLSTSSISMFQTMGTTQTCMTHKTKGKVKLPIMTNTVNSTTDTTLSGSTFMEKDINYLLSRIIQALQVQTPSGQSKSTPPGGDTTGQAK